MPKKEASRAVATPWSQREWRSASASRWRCCAVLCEATSPHKEEGIVPHQGDPSPPVKGEEKETAETWPSHLTPHCHFILQSHLLSLSIRSALNSTAPPTCGTCNGQLTTVPLNDEWSFLTALLTWFYTLHVTFDLIFTINIHHYSEKKFYMKFILLYENYIYIYIFKLCNF